MVNVPLFIALTSWWSWFISKTTSRPKCATHIYILVISEHFIDVLFKFFTSYKEIFRVEHLVQQVNRWQRVYPATPVLLRLKSIRTFDSIGLVSGKRFSCSDNDNNSLKQLRSSGQRQRQVLQTWVYNICHDFAACSQHSGEGTKFTRKYEWKYNSTIMCSMASPIWSMSFRQ